MNTRTLKSWTRGRRGSSAARAVLAAGLTIGSVLAVSPTFGQSQGGSRPEPARPEGVVMHDTPSVVVTGRGVVSVKPDRAVLNTGVMAQEPTAEAAMRRCAEAMQRVLKALAAQGVPEARIQTAGLSLSPVYERYDPSREPAEPKIVAYRADNTVRVEVDDVSTAGAVIDAAVKAGANQSFGISFEIKDESAAREDALRLAVRGAQAKAKAIAGALQRPLGEIIEVVEGVQTDWPRPMARYGAMAAASEASTPVSAGELRVEATVTVRYALRPGS